MPKAGEVSHAADRPAPRNGSACALDLDNAFWRFSLAVYASDGVAQECLALQDASSVAGLLITTEAMVAEKPEKKAAPAMPPGGGMGGMGGMDF